MFLVGFMGVGKSAVGRALADRLGWDFVDIDEAVEAAESMTIEEIFRAYGEGRFREAEWEALRALDGRRRVVVATGGGLFLGVVQRAFMKARGPTIWLDTPLSLAVARVAEAATRPLWPAGDALARRAFFEKRRAIYALADVRVDAATGDPVEVAARVDAGRSAFWH